MPVPIRPAVAGIPRYAAGKPPGVGPGGVSYKLSSNENPYPPLPSVLAKVTEACTGLNRYPDAANTAISQAIADRWGVSIDQVVFGTGSVGVLYHLLQVTCEAGDEVVYPWRSFEAYPIAVQLTGATSVQVPLTPDCEHDLAAMAAAVTERTRAVLLCTPNNPTGPALRHDDVVAFLDRVDRSIMVIIDEAYVEFATESNLVRTKELLDRDNVVVLRTFSKAYGLAGFRVGYGIAEPNLAAATRLAALPFGVSVPAQAAVLASLAAEDELLARVSTLQTSRDQLADQLRDLGLKIPAAQGNFVWVEAGDHTAMWAEHWSSQGISVRPFAVGKPTDGIRISVGEPAANALVVELAATLPLSR